MAGGPRAGRVAVPADDRLGQGGQPGGAGLGQLRRGKPGRTGPGPHRREPDAAGGAHRQGGRARRDVAADRRRSTGPGGERGDGHDDRGPATVCSAHRRGGWRELGGAPARRHRDPGMGVRPARRGHAPASVAAPLRDCLAALPADGTPGTAAAVRRPCLAGLVHDPRAGGRAGRHVRRGLRGRRHRGFRIGAGPAGAHGSTRCVSPAPAACGALYAAAPGAGRRCRARRASAGGAGRQPGFHGLRGAGAVRGRVPRAGCRCGRRRRIAPLRALAQGREPAGDDPDGLAQAAVQQRRPVAVLAAEPRTRFRGQGRRR